MPDDEALAARMRDALGGLPGVSETRMMGGICFLLYGNMIGGVRREKSGAGHFMFRVGKDNEAVAAQRAEAVQVEMGGRRMGGFFYVDEEVPDRVVAEWVSLALEFVGSLPPKPPKKPKAS
ncbi:TfoX-like protein [Aliiruegeria haliotis]|uniref:TfoX-like protein n=1 Tax=Aliiruegeria haliotis TaxID=1280846 RepID=A0A2T0RZI6_9RHOB|nr:TfoX/Sxy family protein [Aliiruegeria haliotis]PRY26591.1 TfoX-like protein [Aliiruegeria haliotis]